MIISCLNMATNSIVKSGYLQTLGTTVKTWRDRWFVLEEHAKGSQSSHTLAWYKDDKNSDKCIGSLSVLDAEIKISPFKREFVQRMWQFEIYATDGKVYSIRAKTEVEMRQWINALERLTGIDESNAVLDAIQDYTSHLEFETACVHEVWMQKTSSNLMDILFSPSLRDKLESYLAAKHCEENLLFWKEAEIYRITPIESARERIGWHIYHQHLHAHAPYEITVSDSIRASIKQQLEARDFAPGIFVSLQRQIFNLMKATSFKSFIESDIYMNICVSLSNSEALKFSNNLHLSSLSAMDGITPYQKIHEPIFPFSSSLPTVNSSLSSSPASPSSSSSATAPPSKKRMTLVGQMLASLTTLEHFAALKVTPFPRHSMLGGETIGEGGGRNYSVNTSQDQNKNYASQQAEMLSSRVPTRVRSIIPIELTDPTVGRQQLNTSYNSNNINNNNQANLSEKGTRTDQACSRALAEFVADNRGIDFSRMEDDANSLAGDTSNEEEEEEEENDRQRRNIAERQRGESEEEEEEVDDEFKPKDTSAALALARVHEKLQQARLSSAANHASSSSKLNLLALPVAKPAGRNSANQIPYTIIPLLPRNESVTVDAKKLQEENLVRSTMRRSLMQVLRNSVKTNDFSGLQTVCGELQRTSSLLSKGSSDPNLVNGQDMARCSLAVQLSALSVSVLGVPRSSLMMSSFAQGGVAAGKSHGRTVSSMGLRSRPSSRSRKGDGGSASNHNNNNNNPSLLMQRSGSVASLSLSSLQPLLEEVDQLSSQQQHFQQQEQQRTKQNLGSRLRQMSVSLRKPKSKPLLHPEMEEFAVRSSSSPSSRAPGGDGQEGELIEGDVVGVEGNEDEEGMLSAGEATAGQKEDEEEEEEEEEFVLVGKALPPTEEEKALLLRTLEALHSEFDNEEEDDDNSSTNGNAAAIANFLTASASTHTNSSGGGGGGGGSAPQKSKSGGGGGEGGGNEKQVKVAKTAKKLSAVAPPLPANRRTTFTCTDNSSFGAIVGGSSTSSSTSTRSASTANNNNIRQHHPRHGTAWQNTTGNRPSKLGQTRAARTLTNHLIMSSCSSSLNEIAATSAIESLID